MKMKGKLNLIGGIFLIVCGMMFSQPSIERFGILSVINPFPMILSLALILIGIFELVVFFRKDVFY